MFQRIKSTSYQYLKRIERLVKVDLVYLTRGGFWLTLGQVFASLSSFVMAVVFAHFLPREVYGEYKYVLSIIGIITILSLPGTVTALTRAMANNFEGTFWVSFKAKVRWSILASLACLGMAAYYWWNRNTALVMPFVIAAFFIPFMDTFELYQSYLQGKKRFKESTKFKIFTQLISVTCMITVAVVFRQLAYVILSYFAAWTVTRFIFMQYVLRKNKFNEQVDGSAVTYSKHLSLMNVISYIANYADVLLVFHYLGAKELAIYTIAVAPPEQIKSFLSLMDTLYFPKFVSKTAAQAKAIFKKNFLPLLLIGSLIIGAYIVCARFLFSIFFPAYMDAIFYSQIFAVPTFSQFTYQKYD